MSSLTSVVNSQKTPTNLQCQCKLVEVYQCNVLLGATGGSESVRLLTGILAA